MVWRALVVLAFFLVITGSVYALAAANTVPPTRLGNMQVRNYVGNDAQKARDFAPPECASIRSSLSRIVYIGIPPTPTNDSELVLGTAGNNTINARGGNDCVLGGGGDDSLCGGQIRVIRGDIFCTEGISNSNDVIIGGPGNDSVAGGPGWDVCYGEWDFDSSCEEFYSPG